MGMFGGNVAVPSLADIAAVTRNNDGNGNNGWGDGNGWWVLIILFAIFGGWGNGNGWGGNNGGSQGALTRSDLCQDMNFSDMASGIRGISQGICDSTFALNNTITNGFAGVNNAVCDLGFSMAQQFNATQMANMQNTNALSRQFADCCCDNRAAIKDLQYNMATESCATNNNIHQTGDAIINSQTQGFQMLNNTIQQGFTNLEFQNQQRYIAELERKLNACDRDSALLAMSNSIVNQLQPCPRPAYLTCNPNTGLVWPQGTCGCGSVQSCCG